MALFGGKNGKKEDRGIKPLLPPARVKAFAKLDIEKYLGENPIEISEPGDIKWRVKYSEDGATVHGEISIPISLHYEYGDLENDEISDDLQLLCIDVDGERVLDDTPDDGEFDPLATVDVEHIESHAKMRRGDLLGHMRERIEKARNGE